MTTKSQIGRPKKDTYDLGGSLIQLPPATSGIIFLSDGSSIFNAFICVSMRKTARKMIYKLAKDPYNDMSKLSFIVAHDTQEDDEDVYTKLTPTLQEMQNVGYSAWLTSKQA